VADSHCGFCWNHRCTDMIFCAHQLIGKAIEHNTKAFLSFGNLRKAYDSVPRDVMWLILSKYGVPEKLVSLIRSFHDDMQAGISVGDNVTQVVFSNGLRQGCALAPILFVLFFNMVIQCWHDRCQGLGIKLLYKCGGKLVGERARTLLESWLTELCFADDAVIMAPTKDSIVKATVELDRVVRACGLIISIPKT